MAEILLLCNVVLGAPPVQPPPPDPPPDPAPDAINVTDAPYSATGDGTTNDRAAIVSAMAAAISGAKDLYFPAGTYYFTPGITVTDAASWVGDGKTSSWLKGALTYGDNQTLADLKMGNESTANPLIVDKSTVVWTRCAFVGRGAGDAADSAVVNIRDCDTLTFSYCDVATNQDGIGNGIRLIDYGAGAVHDITFDHCTVAYQPRMGIEILGRSDASEGGNGGIGYQNVDVTNCAISIGAGQNLSYDDNSGTAGGCTVSGNVCYGSGAGPAYCRWGRVFEINKTKGMTVTNNVFRRGRDGIINLTGVPGVSMDWSFSGNTIDGLTVVPGVNETNNQLYCMTDVEDVTIADTIINNPDYSMSFGFFENCDSVDFTGSTLAGDYTLPPSAGYWPGSTNMTWPTGV